MIVQNNDNTQLIEFMENLESGFAIEQTYGKDKFSLDKFSESNYRFYKENGNVLVYVNDELIGHLQQTPYGTYEQLMFEHWDTEQYKKVEWLDELDAYLFNYSV